MTAIVSAGQWPEFRGPSGQGQASETGLPLDWSESRNVVWKSAVPGRGWSSPVVTGGRIWLTTSTESAEGRRRGVSLRVLAFDIATGRELVNTEVFRIDRPEPLNGKNSYASPTPIVEGDRVYVHFGAQGTAALTTAGEVVWRDDRGVTCRRWNWRQGIRTRLGADARRMWFILESLGPMPIDALHDAGAALGDELRAMMPKAQIQTSLLTAGGREAEPA